MFHRLLSLFALVTLGSALSACAGDMVEEESAEEGEDALHKSTGSQCQSGKRFPKTGKCVPVAQRSSTSPPAKKQPAAPAPAPQAGIPVLVRWNGVANSEASLDLIMKDGGVVRSCAGVDVLRGEVQAGKSNGLGYLFKGHCELPYFNVNADNIDKFQLCTAVGNNWGAARCFQSAPWSHTNAEVKIENN